MEMATHTIESVIERMRVWAVRIGGGSWTADELQRLMPVVLVRAASDLERAISAQVRDAKKTEAA